MERKRNRSFSLNALLLGYFVVWIVVSFGLLAAFRGAPWVAIVVFISIYTVPAFLVGGEWNGPGVANDVKKSLTYLLPILMVLLNLELIVDEAVAQGHQGLIKVLLFVALQFAIVYSPFFLARSIARRRVHRS